MTRAYDSKNYYRPRKCGCDKVRYRTEADALAAAERLGDEFDTAFRAYRCTGTRVWHLATRGFHPSSLGSDARVLAWHLSVRRVADRTWLFEQFGISPHESARSKPESNKAKKISAILHEFAAFGLVELGVPHPGYVCTLDDAGLARVMAVGLQEFADSRAAAARGPGEGSGRNALQQG